MNALFIGGGHDGQCKDIEPRDVIRLPVRGRSDVFDVYHRMQLRGEMERYLVYAIDGMNGDHILARLIEEYRKSVGA